MYVRAYLTLVGISGDSRSLHTSSCWKEDDFSVEIRKVQCLSALLVAEEDDISVDQDSDV